MPPAQSDESGEPRKESANLHPSVPPGSVGEAAVIQRMLAAKRIAMIGISDDPMKPSHGVANYLQTVGYDILPVNPNHSRVLGVKCYPTLAETPPPIDIVDVFRRPEFCAAVVREAIAAGTKGVWLQSGIRSTEARQIAAEAGIDYIENRCLMVEHMHRNE